MSTFGGGRFLSAGALTRCLFAVVLAALVLLSACSEDELLFEDDTFEPALPERIVPEEAFGLVFHEERGAEAAFKEAGEESLVSEGRVYTARDASRQDDVKGALQLGLFRGDLEATKREIRTGVMQNIGTGRFELQRVGDERIWVQRLAEQHIYLWMPPTAHYYQIFVARHGFEEGREVFAAILAYQRGEDIRQPDGQERQFFDPRRRLPV